jgi:hypothetical protein
MLDGPNPLLLERAEANDVVAWLGNHARVRRMQVNALRKRLSLRLKQQRPLLFFAKGDTLNVN